MGSTLELTFEHVWTKILRYPTLLREYEFAKAEGRKSRFDFADPEAMVGIEIEGGTWGRGRHTSGAGYAKDCRKYNMAAYLGWDVLRFTSDRITGLDACMETCREIKRHIDGKKDRNEHGPDSPPWWPGAAD